jgi:hypothetical protein
VQARSYRSSTALQRHVGAAVVLLDGFSIRGCALAGARQADLDAWLTSELDVEAGVAGTEMFHGLGSAARDALVVHVAEATSPSVIVANATHPAYQDLIWPIVALHRWAVMPRLGLAGSSHLAFPEGGLGASGKVSDNGSRLRPTQRDAPRHSQPSELR